MTHDEFRALVLDLRLAQRAYFQRRDRAKLEYARRLEKRVDDALGIGRGNTLFDRAGRPSEPNPAPPVAGSGDAR